MREKVESRNSFSGRYKTNEKRERETKCGKERGTGMLESERGVALKQ